MLYVKILLITSNRNVLVQPKLDMISLLPAAYERIVNSILSPSSVPWPVSCILSPLVGESDGLDMLRS